MDNATPIVVPDLGTASAVFGQWLVGEGEAVTEGDRVAELLIPGASIDVAAPRTGILHHRAGRGDSLRIDDVIGSVRTDRSPNPLPLPSREGEKKQAPFP